MTMKRFFCAALLSASAALALAQDGPYDESADANAQVAAALQSAHAAHKLPLLVFGANWCPDCRLLDIEMRKGKLAALVGDKFVVVKVDVGRFDRNTDVAARFGVPLGKGIPAVAVLREDGSVAYLTAGGELADARKMGGEGIAKFFDDMAARVGAARS